LLLAPAEAAVARASRLLVSPDGPLHLLPFAALTAPSGASPPREARYLVEEKPILYSLSASLHAELRQSRHGAGRRGPGFAFVAPAFPPAGAAGGGEGGALARYRAGLPRLAGPRAEAEGLAALFSGDLTVFTGTEARERKVKELQGRAGFVHFASHALLDHGSPLDSGVALAAPAGETGDEDNGLLQAWEVFDQVRLDTDLVTLSACETGLGGDGAGEGLVGLSRAFQYAGARSVLASLWQVSDRSTAELMRRFYGAWAAGRSRDLALAEAQRALIAAGGPSAHPFHWAAFTLSGDAR
jgi:CHAT domain-containing protein